MMRQSNKAISLKIISELSGLKSWNILLEMARLGLVSWKTTWKLGIGGLSLYTLGQIGATLGDKTALSLGYKTPEGLNVNEFKKVLIDQADEQVKPFIEKTLEELYSVDDEEKQERLNQVLTDLDKTLQNI